MLPNLIILIVLNLSNSRWNSVIDALIQCALSGPMIHFLYLSSFPLSSMSPAALANNSEAVLASPCCISCVIGIPRRSYKANFCTDMTAWAMACARACVSGLSNGVAGFAMLFPVASRSFLLYHGIGAFSTALNCLCTDNAGSSRYHSAGVALTYVVAALQSLTWFHGSHVSSCAVHPSVGVFLWNYNL